MLVLVLELDPHVLALLLGSLEQSYLRAAFQTTSFEGKRVSFS